MSRHFPSLLNPPKVDPMYTPRRYIMNDSDEWASASDSELQDDELQPVRTTQLADSLTPHGDETSANKSSSIDTADNSTQQGSAEPSGEKVKLKDTHTLPPQEPSAPPPYEMNSKILEEKLPVPSETSSDGNEGNPQLTEEQRETSVSSGWGSWGSGWLSKAANTVASSAHSLASNTEIGISSLVNTVESSFGIPTPESMASRDVVGEKEDCVSGAAVSLKESAQRLKEEQNQVENDDIPKDTTGPSGDNTECKEQGESSGFFSSYGISLTNKLVSGGLDTLENLGKKTIGLISEGDPGLRNKRAFVQEQIDILTKEKITDAEIDSDTPALTSFHLEFEQLQGYVYLEALEILSNECESKQHLKMHSVSTRPQEGGVTPGVEELTGEMFEISFESETASSELADLLPSCKGLVSLERIQQTVGEMEACDESFDKIELSRDALLPQFNSAMRLIAKLSSQYIQVVRKVSELCLSQQVPLKETLSHSKELALIAYRHIDKITTRIALIEVSDDVISNKFILDMNSGVSYIQDSFSLLRSVLKSASSS